MSESKQIPVMWEGVPPRIIELGMKFGLIRIGWTLKHYVLHAIENMGYETNLLWGERGGGKSNRLLAHGYWVYQDWDDVLKHIKFRAKDVVRTFKEIPLGERIPWLGWDDLTVHFPSTSWRTNIEQYEAIDSAWAALRPKCSVVDLTCPLIDRVPKNLKDSITNEVYVGRNQTLLIERYLRIPGIKDVGSYFRKIQIEPIHQFDMYEVPTSVFKEYWDERLRLTEEALDRLDKTISKEESDSPYYVSITKVGEELGLSLQTLTNMISRGSIRGERINGLLHILIEDYEALKRQEMEKRRKRQQAS